MQVIEVFKTDIHDTVQAGQITGLLQQRLPGCRIGFDLDDCDRVLRICGENIDTELVISLVTGHGFFCDVLE